MINFLLISEDANFREMFAFSLEATFQSVVSRAGNVQEALNFLLDETPYGLILTEESVEHVKLFKYLLTVNANIPIVIIDDGKTGEMPQALQAFPELRVIGRVKRSNAIEHAQKILAEAMKKGIIKSDPQPTEYCRIRTDLLVKVIPLKADVYIRLSSIKFVKLFSHGDVFEQTDVDRYLHKKGVAYLYLKKDAVPIFIEAYSRLLGEIVSGQKPGLEEEPPTTLVSAYEATMELARLLGFTPEIQGFIQKNVQMVMKSVKANRRLSQLVQSLDKSHHPYLSYHTVLLGQLTCGLAKQLTWYSESTYEKIIYASMLHDVGLTGMDIGPINPLKDASAKGRRLYLPEDNDRYLKHPSEGASIVKTFREIPGDVDTIIMQHHERPDGSGFPRQLVGNKISPLSALFTISHDLVSAYLGKEVTAKEVLDLYRLKYSTGPYKKILQSIEI